MENCEQIKNNNKLAEEANKRPSSLQSFLEILKQCVGIENESL